MSVVGRVWVERVLSRGLDGAKVVEIDDVDTDTRLDLLAAGRLGEGDIAWWENRRSGPPPLLLHQIGNHGGPNTLVSIDIDGDGDHDVASSGSLGGGVSWWENRDGSGEAWRERVLIEFGTAAEGIAAGDIDGDGDIDLLSNEVTDDVVLLWENLDGAGAFESSTAHHSR